MNAALLSVRFRLHGCTSLKEKRSRLRGLKDRWGKNPSLAVCEAEDADALDRSLWCFLAMASSGKVVEQLLTDVERDVQDGVDAEVIELEREWLT